MIGALAARLDGQIWPGTSGVSWVSGKGGPHGRLLTPESYYRQILPAQETCRAICALPTMPFSTGRLARAIMAWVGPPSKKPDGNNWLLEETGYAYHDCKPGLYTEKHYLWDVKACYHTIACKARHPYPIPSRKGVVLFPKCDPDVIERWRDSMQAVSECKILRNSIVGSAMGSSGWRMVFSRGPGSPTKRDGTPNPWYTTPDAEYHCTMLKLPGGPWRDMGALVVRSAWEIARAASLEARSVYSATDCVCTTADAPPTVWDRFGLRCEVMAEGAADIRGLGVWKVGEKKTDFWEEGFPVDTGRGKYRAQETPTAPLVNFCSAWI
jgi:hypothetical protein